MVGYSGTSLAKKLGLTQPLTVVTINAPAGYREWLGDLPNGVRIADGLRGTGPVSAVHLFDTRRDAMAQRLARLRQRLEPAGFVWVSWPKKASRVATDITEDVIREVALPMGFVDVKVCAVSDVWSGLKLVIRKSERLKDGLSPTSAL